MTKNVIKRLGTGRKPIQSKSIDHDRTYGRRWKAARKAYLAKHPLCVECAKQGLTVAAEDIDHIIPHKGNYRLMWDETNYQALCHSHHSSKTGKERCGLGV